MASPTQPEIFYHEKAKKDPSLPPKRLVTCGVDEWNLLQLERGRWRRRIEPNLQPYNEPLER